METDVIALIDFILGLPPSHQVLLTLGLVMPMLGFLAMSWRWGHGEGRNFEVLHGRVPPLNDELAKVRAENRQLGYKLEEAREQIRVLQENCRIAHNTTIELPPEVKEVLRLREALFQSNSDMWRLREPRPLPHLRERLVASSLKIITVGNLKGGVGKTTLTCNLAAFFEKKFGKRVLVVDLDYQGSLSAALLQAASKRIDASLADDLIAGDARVLRSARDIVPVLNNVRLVSASYSLAAVEEQLMMRWLFHTTDKDVRFNLAEVLLSDEVKENYDIVLLDTGPRLTTASISALCASTHLLVPTNLDGMSAETIASFLRRVRLLKEALDLPIQLAGVVGTMTYYYGKLTDDEKDVLSTIRDGLKQWDAGGVIFDRAVPRIKKLADIAGAHIGYLKDKRTTAIFDTLGQQIVQRVSAT
jgi:cellulose biosynthesis protein BcsQ